MKVRFLLTVLAVFTMIAMNSCSTSTRSKADAVLENIHYGKW